MNWFNLPQGFYKFTNRLRIKFNQVIDKTKKTKAPTPVMAVTTFTDL